MFCQNCGKEVAENACICLGCGCWVDVKKVKQTERETKQEIKEKEEREPALWVKIFLIVSFSLVCVSFGCILLSISHATIYDTGYYYDPDLVIRLNSAWMLVSFITGICALGFAIVGFIFGLRAERVFKYASIINFICAVGTFLLIFLS